jgi:hypothetical protein
MFMFDELLRGDEDVYAFGSAYTGFSSQYRVYFECMHLGGISSRLSAIEGRLWIPEAIMFSALFPDGQTLKAMSKRQRRVFARFTIASGR